MAAHEQPGDGWTVVLIRPFAGGDLTGVLMLCMLLPASASPGLPVE